jgi:hypothetical protein
MNFLVGQTGNIYDSITSVIIQDGADTVFNVQLPSQEDTIAGWRSLLTYLHNTDLDELKNLLASIPQLLETDVDEEAHATYLHMLRALFKWLEEIQEQASTAYDFQTLHKLYKQLECALFHFKVDDPHNGFYEAVFSQPGEELLKIEIPSDKFDKSPVPVSQVVLTRACESYPEQIEQFIDDYLYFQAHVVKDDPKTFNVFFCLSKALIKLIKQEKARLGMYISRVPDICTFIVKNEQDAEEQKTYLELILGSLEHIEYRLERLDDIIKDIQNEIPQRKAENQIYSKQQKEDGHRRLMHVISIISNYYLMLYDFTHSANFWRKAKIKDPLLLFFLTFHRWPFLYLFGEVLLLAIPSFVAYQHWKSPGVNDPLIVTASDPLFLFILIWYVLLFLLAFSILVQIMRKRWLYSQLLLPRFLGAAIVGLVPLLLYDQSWLIRIQNYLINWLSLALFFYTISFIFMFIHVYNILKLAPGRSMTEILRLSGHSFGIALSETLFIVTIASTLILPVLLQRPDPLGISIPLGTWLSLGFFPSLILLWTAITLFIGSFVQLWGQGQRITEPI